MSEIQRPFREDGFYAGRVIDHTVSRSRNDNPQVVLLTEMFGRYDSCLSDPGNYRIFPAFPRRVFWVVTLDREEEGRRVQGTAARVLGDLQYLGFKGKSLAELKCDFEFPRQRVWMWELRNEWYEGKVTERWGLFRFQDRDDPRRVQNFLDLTKLFVEERRPRRQRREETENNGVPEVVG